MKLQKLKHCPECGRSKSKDTAEATVRCKHCGFRYMFNGWVQQPSGVKIAKHSDVY